MSGYIFKSNTTLDHREIQNGAKGKGSIFSKLSAKINAMYEHLTSQPVPGSGNRSMVGHDHTSFGGGAILPRGMMFCMDNGCMYEPTNPFSINGYSAQLGASWSNMPLTGYSPSIMAYITEGIDNSKNNNLLTTCVGEAYALILCDHAAGLPGVATFDFQIINRETGTSSAVISVVVAPGASDLAWHLIPNIPIGTGGWQSYDIITSCTQPGNACTLNLCALIFAETYESTQPKSAGTDDYVSAGTRPL